LASLVLAAIANENGGNDKIGEHLTYTKNYDFA